MAFNTRPPGDACDGFWDRGVRMLLPSLLMFAIIGGFSIFHPSLNPVNLLSFQFFNNCFPAALYLYCTVK